MNNYDRLTPDTTNNSDSEERELYLMTSARQAIPMKLMNLIKAQVEIVVPLMKRDEQSTLKKLCDEVFWNDLTHWQRTNAGKCMTYMVDAGMLPLTPDGKTTENAKLYRRI